jgi:hypothetical protein
MAVVMAVQGALGLAMVELSMVRLNTPAFFPFFFGLRLDPLWFGIRNVTIAEIGVILPPMDKTCPRRTRSRRWQGSGTPSRASGRSSWTTSSAWGS